MAFKLSRATRARMTLLSLAMFAGGLGGAVYLVLTVFWRLVHISGSQGVMTHLDEHRDFLEHVNRRVLWGALWGLLFLIPLQKAVKNFWLRTLLFALPPALVEILVMLPYRHLGVLGIRAGPLTSIYILLNTILGWTLPAYIWLGATGYATPTPFFEYEESEPLLES